MTFAERCRGVELELELTNRYVDVVGEGFDLALRGGRGDDATLVVRRLGSYRLRAVAAPSWLAVHGRIDPEASLPSVDCVVLAPFRGTGNPRGTRRNRGASRPRHLVANDLATVVDGALRGLGVAVLPEHVCVEHLRAGRLVSAHPRYDPLEVPLYGAYPDRRYMPAALTAFLALASEAFG